MVPGAAYLHLLHSYDPDELSTWRKPANSVGFLYRETGEADIGQHPYFGGPHGKLWGTSASFCPGPVRTLLLFQFGDAGGALDPGDTYSHPGLLWGVYFCKAVGQGTGPFKGRTGFHLPVSALYCLCICEQQYPCHSTRSLGDLF